MTRTRTTRPFADCPLGRYAVVIHWTDEDRCFVAYVPDLEPCSAFGDTPEEALREIQVAADLWLEVAREYRMTIPPVRFGPENWQSLSWDRTDGAPREAEGLKRALRAEIDEAAWASLYTTKSRPFPSPASGKIAVKVINHYGDEVLHVYRVAEQAESRTLEIASH